MSPTVATANSTQVPTRARRTVLWFAVTLAAITYIDRICISQAAPEIRHELNLSPQQMGWVFSAFTITYALFEIPAGLLGDRYGPRSILMKVVVMWSFFTAATGWAWNFASMVVCRGLFGAGEAGCFPNLTKIFTIWMPFKERVTAQGILWLSARWGGAFTPLLVAGVLGFVNWRWAFGFFGFVGIIWAVLFYRWFRDNPRDHPAVNAAELAQLDGAEKNAPGHAPIPWKRFLTSRAVLLLWFQYFCVSYGWYFYITWLPTYLREAKHVALGKSALLAGLPLFFGGIGCFVGAWAARRIAEVWDVRRARRVVASTGCLIAAVMLVCVTQLHSPVLAMVAMGIASFGNDLSMPCSWGACMDIGGRHAGSLSGSMNMMGNFGGAAGPVIVGYILAFGKASPTAAPSLESWTIALLAGAVVYGGAALSWAFIDPVTSLDTDAPARATI